MKIVLLSLFFILLKCTLCAQQNVATNFSAEVVEAGNNKYLSQDVIKTSGSITLEENTDPQLDFTVYYKGYEVYSKVVDFTHSRNLNLKLSIPVSSLGLAEGTKEVEVRLYTVPEQRTLAKELANTSLTINVPPTRLDYIKVDSYNFKGSHSDVSIFATKANADPYFSLRGNNIGSIARSSSGKNTSHVYGLNAAFRISHPDKLRLSIYDKDKGRFNKDDYITGFTLDIPCADSGNFVNNQGENTGPSYHYESQIIELFDNANFSITDTLLFEATGVFIELKPEAHSSKRSSSEFITYFTSGKTELHYQVPLLQTGNNYSCFIPSIDLLDVTKIGVKWIVTHHYDKVTVQKFAKNYLVPLPREISISDVAIKTASYKRNKYASKEKGVKISYKVQYPDIYKEGRMNQKYVSYSPKIKILAEVECNGIKESSLNNYSFTKRNNSSSFWSYTELNLLDGTHPITANTTYSFYDSIIEKPITTSSEIKVKGMHKYRLEILDFELMDTIFNAAKTFIKVGSTSFGGEQIKKGDSYEFVIHEKADVHFEFTLYERKKYGETFYEFIDIFELSGEVDIKPSYSNKEMFKSLKIRVTKL